ncbi:phosphatidylethanolamine N-methyltransferase, partial [Nowakowskiella sp. JEL0078]
LLIALHIWTAVSIYQVLGDFGWFYGDFFIDELLYRQKSRPAKLQQSAHKKTWHNRQPTLQFLRYTGIYRFLNNPEKIMGHAAFWGLSLITSSWVLFGLTLFGQISNWLFLQYVERPHMKRLYGEEQVRQESGVQKVLRKEVKRVEKVVGLVVEKIDATFETMREVREKLLFEGAVENVRGRSWRRIRSTEDLTNWARRSFSMPNHIEYDGDLADESEIDDDELTMQGDRELLKSRARRVNSDFNFTKTVTEEKKLRKRPKRMSSFTEAVQAGRQVVTDVVGEVEKMVDQAAPRVQAIVEKVIKREGIDPFQHLPLELYSLTFPASESQPTRVGPPRFLLGEPIIIEFTTPRETVKHNDWVGLYSVTQNHRKNLTTSQSRGRWLFLTGTTSYDEDLPPQLIVKSHTPPSLLKEDVITELDTHHHRLPSAVGTFGNTHIEIFPSSDPGLRLVRGRLVFHGDKLPWTIGVYEARYHYDLKYHVLARSIPFEVVAEPFLLYSPDTRALPTPLIDPRSASPDDLRAVYDEELNVPIDESTAEASEDGLNSVDAEEDDTDKDSVAGPPRWLVMEESDVVQEIENVLGPYVQRILDVDGENILNLDDDILGLVKKPEKRKL